jgi:cytoskeletal protein RodZ
MVLFRRDKEESTEAPITEPTQQKGWMVWLLSVVTFFLTVAIVLGLFWAGRWVVHQFAKEPPATPTKPIAPDDATVNNTRDNAARTAPDTSANNSSNTPSNNNAAPAAPTTPTPPAATSQSTSTTPTTTPTTGPTLVNTGPDSDE